MALIGAAIVGVLHSKPDGTSYLVEQLTLAVTGAQASTKLAEFLAPRLVLRLRPPQLTAADNVPPDDPWRRDNRHERDLPEPHSRKAADVFVFSRQLREHLMG